MISVISKFDHKTAAGILARTALAITDYGNPASIARIPDEERIRETLLSEIRSKLQITSNDQSEGSIDRIAEQLDIESDKLIGAIDEKSVLSSMAAKGYIPSDLFEVSVIDQVKEIYGKNYASEELNILSTVKSPDQEQHYGTPSSPEQPFLISLFAKNFENKFPLKSYTLLVVGQRNGLQLSVHQVWRVYHDRVDLSNITDLIDMLQRFSDKFGAEIEVGGVKGHFFRELNFEKSAPFTNRLKFKFLSDGKLIEDPKRLITFTAFTQNEPSTGKVTSAMALAIDLKLYKDFLRQKN